MGSTTFKYLVKHDFINLLCQMRFKKLELALHKCVIAMSGNPPTRVTIACAYNMNRLNITKLLIWNCK